LNTFGAGAAAQVLISRGELPEEARDAILPVPVQQSPLFNPALDYVQFLLAAVVPSVLQIFICASAALSVALDAQHVRGVPRMLALGGSPLRAALGKLAPYALAYLFVLCVADAILFGFFGAPFNGSLGLHLLYTVVFVVACLSLGALLGVVAGDTIGALGMTGVLTGPAFGFAGISFPRLTMNSFAWAWGGLLPLTPYLQLRTDQVLRGAPVDVSLPTLGWLMAQVAIYGALLLVMLSRKAAQPATATSEGQS
jgi:ABC-2 type transport system permease protein